MNEKRHIRPGKAAKIAGFSPFKIQHLAKLGAIKSYLMPSGERRIDLDSLMSYLDRSGVPTRVPGGGLADAEVVTAGDVARMLRVAPRTVVVWTDSGALPSYLIPYSKHRRILRSDLARFVAEHGMPRDFLVTKNVVTVCLDPFLVTAIQDRLPGVGVRDAQTVFAAGVLVERYRPVAVVIDPAIGRIETATVVQSLRADPESDLARRIVLGQDAPADADAIVKALGFLTPAPVCA